MSARTNLLKDAVDKCRFSYKDVRNLHSIAFTKASATHKLSISFCSMTTRPHHREEDSVNDGCYPRQAQFLTFLAPIVGTTATIMDLSCKAFAAVTLQTSLKSLLPRCIIANLRIEKHLG